LFKISVHVEIGHFHSQLFRNSSFHLFVFMGSRLPLKRDGTRWRTGEVKGKQESVVLGCLKTLRGYVRKDTSLKF
jgi:hypothetical protein